MEREDCHCINECNNSQKHEMVDKVTKHMEECNIDIACIQETHFDTNEMIRSNDYNILLSWPKSCQRERSQQNIKGVVSIAIRKIYNISN